MNAEQMAQQMQERIPVSAKDTLDEFARLCAQPTEFDGRGTGDGTESAAEVRTRFARLLDENGYRTQMERYKARPRFIRWLTSGTRRKLEALREQCFLAVVMEVVGAMADRCYSGCNEIEPGLYEHTWDFLGQSPLTAAQEKAT